MITLGSNILKGDKSVWTVAFFLTIMSIPVVYSASGFDAFKHFGGNTDAFLYKQVIGVIVSMIIIYLAHLLPFKLYLTISKYFLPVVLFLLLLTLIVGIEKNGTKRWLSFFGIIELQTSELGKLALIMYSARLLALNYANRIDLKKAVTKIIIATILTVVLIVLEDVSTGLLIYAIIFVLMYIGRVNLVKLLKISAFMFLLLGLVMFVSYSFGFRNRMDTSLGRISEIYSGTQVKIAKAAIVKGGVFGEGPGNGVMKYTFSQSQNDFVYAYAIEEYGLFAAIMIPVFFLVLFYRGINIAKKSNKPFAMFLTIGLTLGIVLQAFVHMAVAVNLIPPTGQTLPFLSSGLTSLFVYSFALGIILNVSRINDSKNDEIEDEEK